MKNKTILTLILGSVIAIFAILYFMYFRSVTVSFTAKIGAGIAPITVKVGEKITEPVAPKSDEYKFLGWYINDEKVDFSEPFTEDSRVTAKWEKVGKLFIKDLSEKSSIFIQLTNQNANIKIIENPSLPAEAYQLNIKKDFQYHYTTKFNSIDTDFYNKVIMAVVLN